MGGRRSSADLASFLMRGPRGRRLLLEYALASEGLHHPEYHEGSLRTGVFFASYHLDPAKGTSSLVMFSIVSGAAPEPTVVSAGEVAERMAEVPLAEATPALLRDCLRAAVDAARYWQEPDGSDILAASEAMRAGLQRVAEHLAASAASPHTEWWWRSATEHPQSVVAWEGAPAVDRPADPEEVLWKAREREIEAELAARRDRPADPTANYSGEWWSRPSWEIPSSTGALFDGSPAALWFVEDSLGWERAGAIRLGAPSGLRIYEIEDAEAWARLCARFPLDVTAQKRHDWYRTTGRSGAWVVPDWVQVAEHYDAVHLKVSAYLAAAGTAIAVDDETASVIAGWNPDETYWFTPNVRYLDESVSWRTETREFDAHVDWVRAEADGEDEDQDQDQDQGDGDGDA